MPWEPDALWQDLISVALVGTERQTWQPPAAPGALGQVLGQLAHHSPEAALLTTAATLSLYTQAGRVTSVATAASDTDSSDRNPCLRDTLPPCPPQRTRYLLRILDGEHPLVLPEWLGLVAQASQRLPDAYLPDVLDLGRQQTSLRPAIAKVLGERGQWLARQNLDWYYAVQITRAEDWETGNAAARLMFLTHLRSQDPSQVLTVLENSWSQESAADRAKFLSTLRIGLSLADEPFLIKASCDRSKEVRRVAADLLASLPESALCQRMTERVRQWVRVTPSGDAFEIQLPDTCDQAMQDDGILLQPQPGKGERTEWLRQIIAATPLAFWQELQPQGIPALIDMAQRSEWQDLLLSGWQWAVQRQGNAQTSHAEPLTWASELLKTSQAQTPENLPALLGVLPPADQQVVLLQLFEAELNTAADIQPDFQNHQPQTQPQNIQVDAPIWAALSFLAQQPQDWDDPLSLRALGLMRRFVSTGKAADVWRMREVFSLIALRLTPTLITEAATLRTIAAATPWENTIHTFLATLQFRHEIRAVFQEAAVSPKL